MDTLILALGMGKQLSAPETITGGLLHKMMKIQCDSGIYAVKQLNPQIMKRKEALENMMLSERIATALKNTVPVVSAIEWQGQHVHIINGHYYIVYPWMDGNSIFPPHITKDHCTMMGDILGKIHQADVKVPGVLPGKAEEMDFNWQCVPDDAWLSSVYQAIPLIEKYSLEANEGVKRLCEHQVISHRDLDPKNVLWQGDRPFLIDWEAAGFVNPYQEMMETAFYWADDGHRSLIEENFKAFLTAYGKYITLDYKNWEAVFSACYHGMLGWLYYSLRRGCGLETVDESDLQTGRKQTIETIQALQALETKNKLAYKWIKQL